MTNQTIQYIKIGVFIAVALTALIYSLSMTDIGKRPSQGYDEEMWVSSSVASYNMFCKGYIRNTKSIENWFPTYAYKNGVDIFAQLGNRSVNGKLEAFSRNAFFNPDTVKFPYDIISLDTLGNTYPFVIKYDTIKFPREHFQWFDRDMWTFGWKAPNAGKYIMGWYLDKFASEKPDPNGYFRYNNRYKNDEPTNVTFSYAPFSMVGEARIPNAIMCALAIIIVFMTGWMFLNYGTGLVASVYLLFNFQFMGVNTAVGLDSFSIFFMALAIFHLAGTIKRVLTDSPLWKTSSWALATALAFGLAVSSKLNAALFAYLCIPVYLFTLFAILRRFFQERGNTKINAKDFFRKRFVSFVVSGLIIALIGPGIFVYLNPQYQGDTLALVKTTRQSVDDYFTRRGKDQKQKGYEVVKDNPSKAFGLMMKRNFIRSEKVEKPFYGTFGYRIPFRGNFLDGMFAIIGLFALLYTAFNDYRKNNYIGGAFITLASFIILLAGTVDFIWIDFGRYHMAIYTAFALVIGYGFVHVLEWVDSKIKLSDKLRKNA